MSAVFCRSVSLRFRRCTCWRIPANRYLAVQKRTLDFKHLDSHDFVSALRNWTSVGYIDDAMDAIFVFLCLVKAATSVRNCREWHKHEYQTKR